MDKKPEKTVFDLKLHETLMVNRNVEVMKVPGGWIYNYFAPTTVASCFVPEHNPEKEIL